MTKKSEIQQLVRRLSKTEKVLFGTFSSIVATVLVHPLDVIKVRLQVHEKSYNTRQMAWLMLKCEGASALYRGLTAGLMRQATATTTRLLVYNLLNDHLKRLHGLPNTTTLPTQEKVLIGLCAGLAGAFVGNPSEVALVRMMAEGKMEPCGPCIAKSPYRGVLHALYKIARDDGLCTLWRGGALTMGRSVVLSIAQIGVYAEVNTRVGKRKILKDSTLHVFTSIVSSFVSTVLSLPIDLIKTRYQVRRDNMTQSAIFKDIVQRKGILYLWKGIVPYYIRMAVHTASTLIIMEKITEILYYEKKDT
ncbi:hypothetical protein evm_007337 [Chilo suppressalis]|nr:hypothetical protein evm_007337 [Chilo suppressalis]